MRKVQQLMNRLMTYAPVDAAADQMAKKYIHDSLPPVLTEGSCLEQPCLLFLPPVFCLLASLVDLLFVKYFLEFLDQICVVNASIVSCLQCFIVDAQVSVISVEK